MSWKNPFLSIALIVVLLSNLISAEREEKILSLFNIVKFHNDPCDADGGSKNGTCYTEQECSDKGGTNDGSCAEGYGVCCTFTIKCGTKVAENNTYFESGGSESGGCSVKICPSSNNICQLRLDFDTFTITGPSTLTPATVEVIGGNVSPGAATHSGATQCATDLFSVSNPGGSTTPPSICGSNTGEHMYVASSTACNDLSMLLGTTAVGTTLATRTWSIRVTQWECGFINLAPAGCTQYFYGTDAGTIMTYNYGGGLHLANQNQNQCIRREKGNCKICYEAVGTKDFSVSGSAGADNKFVTKGCCSYGTDGKKSLYDCVIIDGLSTSMGQTGQPLPMIVNNFCGNGGLFTKSSATTLQKALCSKRQPFQVRFQSDNWEQSANEIGKEYPQIGYNLAYTMSSAGC